MRGYNPHTATKSPEQWQFGGSPLSHLIDRLIKLIDKNQ